MWGNKNVEDLIKGPESRNSTNIIILLEYDVC